MGRGSIPSPAGVSASDFHRFFDEKVAGVRASTSSAPPPTFTGAPPGCSLHRLLLTDDDIIMTVRQLPNKHCLSDPIPTTLLKDNIKVLAPFLTDLFNKSLSTGTLYTEHLQVCVHYIASEEA